MHSLLEIQQGVCRALLHPEDTGAAAFITHAGIEPLGRLQIYRNNVRANFLATLRATFPIIERLGGADWFEQSVQRYHTAHPSACGDLQFAGQHYGRFLAADLGATPYDYFADVARLEWAYQEVLTAGSSPVFSTAELRAIDPDDHARIVFVPRTALRLVESGYPLLQIWNANRGDAAGVVNLGDGADAILLIRRDDHVELRKLRAATAALLRQFIAGLPLELAAISAEAECADLDLSRELHDLLAMQAIAAIRLAGECS